MKKLLFIVCLIGNIKGICQFSTPYNMSLRAMMQKTDFGISSGANICGYADKGREYALFGHSNGMSIIDVTNPDVPQIVANVPAVQSLWREVKTYKQFAYVTTEGTGQGLQIVDLSNLPTSVTYKSFNGPDGILSSISRVHALHIDTEKGNVYLFGGASVFSDLGASNGATILSLADPWNPKYIGRIQTPYIHDGYAHNDMLYAANIYNGTLSIIDFKDKNNPITLSTTSTPHQFTHNAWISQDGKYIFTTDERPGSYLTAYDITHLNEPRLVDKIRSNAQNNAIIHNTHILGNYAVSSWYSEGVIITDITRPQNMVHVAQYDTYNGSVGDYKGCWGVYPYLPSGNLVMSNIEGDFYVVTPTYKRACYLEGVVVDASTKIPLSNVIVKIQSTDMDKGSLTNLKGEYYTGQVTNGTFQVTYSKADYIPKTVSIDLINGQITLKNIELVKQSPSISAKIFLEGAYKNGIMRTDLSTTLPLNEPFTALGFTHQNGGGGESTTSSIITNNAIVDWVFVELTSTATPSVSYTRSALLQADGDIVETDGVSPLGFSQAAIGSYTITIKQRNHLKIKTSGTVSIESSGITLDFTNGSVPITGVLKTLSTGLFGLYAGDLNQDGTINIADRNAAWTARNLTGYNQNDCSMNGTVDATDRVNTWNNRNVSSGF
jgi:choice-of-anchor B domain-containing protein